MLPWFARSSSLTGTRLLMPSMSDDLAAFWGTTPDDMAKEMRAAAERRSRQLRHRQHPTLESHNHRYRTGMGDRDFVELTEQEDVFCQLVASNTPAPAAYSIAYYIVLPAQYDEAVEREDPAVPLFEIVETWEQIRSRAYQLTGRLEIKARIKSLRSYVTSAMDISLSRLTQMTMEAYEIGQTIGGKDGADIILKTVDRLARLHGLETMPRENDRLPFSELTPDQQDRLQELLIAKRNQIIEGQVEAIETTLELAEAD